MSKSKFPEKLKGFVERHCQITTDTDSINFSAGNGDIFDLLARWRLVYASIAKTHLQDAILYRASEADLPTLIKALKTSVPGSVPEGMIVDKLTSLLRTRYYEKGGVSREDVILLRPLLSDKSQANFVLESLSKRLFADWPEGRERNAEMDRMLVELRRGKRRRTRAYSLFRWLETYPAELEDDSSWPVRKYLSQLIVNPRTRPRFGEMLSMWKSCSRYPDLEMPLISAMVSQIVDIPSERPKETPRWFVELLDRVEELPFQLRDVVASKAEDIKMYLDFEAGTLKPVEKDDGTRVLEPADLPFRARLDSLADEEFPPKPASEVVKIKEPGLMDYFVRELGVSFKSFLANIGNLKTKETLAKVFS